ncbi:MAG: hypothetical protein E6929_10875 [Clostridium sp.]|nr:hypothetical protein [Clostridium sp.]
MLKKVKLNLETVEAMLYFWQAAAEKDNIAESFFYDVADMPGLKVVYDDEFSGESVRRTLSAIKNREPFDGTKKEKKFWNNNMWMMEDLEFTQAMAAPVKSLNLDSLVEELENVENVNDYEEVEVIFSPLHTDEYIISGNKLVINFFRIKLDLMDGTTSISELSIKEYVKEKIKELLSKKN